MRAQDLYRHLNTYIIKIRLKQKSHSVMMDTTVQARDPEMARRMILNLYGPTASLVGQPRPIKTAK